MLRQNLWKLLLSIAIVSWAVAELVPLKDRPFTAYIRTEAKAYAPEFAAVLKQAQERVASKQAPSVFMALKQIGREQKLDLSRFFPQIRLEASLKNVERRNNILLDELLKRSKGRLQLGLDLEGGVAFTLEVTEKAAGSSQPDPEQNLNKAIEIISTRINSLGVAEPIVRPVGNNRIEVQLPGVTTKDNPEIVANLKKPARLDFRLVHPLLAPETTPPGEIPPGYELMTLEQEERNGEIRTSELFVKRIPEMTGEALSDAYATMDDYGRFKILLRFTTDGAKRFGDVTRTIAEENKRTGRLGQLAIILDGKLYSAPTVREEIPSGSAEITGSFSQREAVELANVLNNPLDLPLEIREQYEVGPSLAKDAIDSGKRAFIISTLLTAGFIVFFYTTGGFLAVIAMLVNVLLLLGVMASIGATLTMPGLAGIVLTLAMSVDSNILIFERMREELKTGKSLPVALIAGFDKAFSAIFDGNLTTLITAVIMVVLGTGPVKGFGVTLAIGIFTTMFAALIISRLLLEWVVNGRLIKRLPMFSVLQNTKFNFLKVAKPAFVASWLIVLVGIGTLVIKGDAIYGIDFTGGDQVSLSFAQKLDLAEVRRVAGTAGVMDIAPSYRTPIGTTHEMLILQTPFEKAKAVVAKLQTTHPEAGFEIVGESRIGPSVGTEIKTNAAWAIFASLIGILLYVAFRFEFGYGVGAVVATVHDLFMTIGIFVLFDRQFNAAMVAAILLIIGYSINDTIVVFDRIREELKLNPTGTLRDVINRSLNLTLSRTIITGGTTLLTSITLILVTSGEVNDIAFTLLIGIITGTFSSLFIASPVFYWWHKGDRKHVEAHHDIAPKYEWTGSSKVSQ
ncbi:MAG: protein translocase subunit SecD [Opitutaceae bacterium]|nr:protein translocase subunit SecD [Opitutaceae bacterium]